MRFNLYLCNNVKLIAFSDGDVFALRRENDELRKALAEKSSKSGKKGKKLSAEVYGFSIMIV